MTEPGLKKMIIDEDFAGLIGDFEPATLGSSPDVIYLLDTDLALRGYNQAWVNFALTNDGGRVLSDWPLGQCVMDAMPAPVEDFYRRAYTGAMLCGDAFTHDYECSSPDEYREFHQVAYALPKHLGLVVSNHLIERRPMHRQPVEFSDRFVGDNGMICMCCHCRTIRDEQTPDRWVWIPQLVLKPPTNITHGLCPLCLEAYYGPAVEDQG